MYEVLGENYYIDVDKIVDICRYSEKSEEVTDDKNTGDGNELNVFKFDCLKVCVDRVVSEYIDEDGDVGSFTSKTTNPGFGISFNTLLKYKIIKKG